MKEGIDQLLQSKDVGNLKLLSTILGFDNLCKHVISELNKPGNTHVYYTKCGYNENGLISVGRFAVLKNLIMNDPRYFEVTKINSVHKNIINNIGSIIIKTKITYDSMNMLIYYNIIIGDKHFNLSIYDFNYKIQRNKLLIYNLKLICNNY